MSLGNTSTRVARAALSVNLRACLMAATGGLSAAKSYLGHVARLSAPGSHALDRVVGKDDVARAFEVAAPLFIPGNGLADGGISMLERTTLALLVQFFGPRRLVEVGTFRGDTTRLLLANSPPDTHIWTMDLPEDVRGTGNVPHASDARLIQTRSVGEVYKKHELADRVTQIYGDTQDPHTWREVPEGVDFAFIDASHSYAAVKADTENLLPKLTEKAVVVWHDYTDYESPERGVGRYIRELMPRDTGLFLVGDTTLSVRVPPDILRSRAATIRSFFPSGDYDDRRPGGAFRWLGL